MCVCVCVCVRACLRACMRACVFHDFAPQGQMCQNSVCVCGGGRSKYMYKTYEGNLILKVYVYACVGLGGEKREG